VTAYTLGDVARICRVPASRLRYWERTALLAPSGIDVPEPAFSFRDLVSVKALVVLLDRGVPLRRIRRSVEAVRARVPEVERPLSALRTGDAGRVVIQHEGSLFEDDGQMVLDFSAAVPGGGVAAFEPPAPAEPSPEEASRWFELGCQLDSERETYAEAIEAYCLAIEADPGYADAHCNLGSLYFNQNRRDPARACFQRALEADAHHLEANLNLASLLEEDGCDEQALRHYKIALAADPLHADSHVSVGLLYEKLGLRRKAREHWRRYLQLEPSGPWSEVARKRLEA
jgi:DNA-binding transcriptional MerR regulator